MNIVGYFNGTGTVFHETSFFLNVSGVTQSHSRFTIYIVVLLLVDHLDWNAALNFVACSWVSLSSSSVYSLESKERGLIMWTFLRTWGKHTFRPVVVAVADRFSSDATSALSMVVGSVLAVLGSSAAFVAVSGETQAPAGTNGDNLDSRCE